jgi:chorismate mutase/prephenate dehydratase
MDVEGHANDPPVKRALDLLRKRSDRIEILGSYPRAQTIEG